MNKIRIPISAILYDPTIYPRKNGPDRQRVARYAASMREGEVFDPLEVEAPDKSGRYRLLDGKHRLDALSETRAAEVEVIVVSLDSTSPLLYAARANRHGKDLSDDEAKDVAKRAYDKDKKLTNKAIAQAIGRSPATVSDWLKDLRAKHDTAQDVKIFKMATLGIPQERIAARLGISQDIVSDHLRKTSDLKKYVNTELERGFNVNTIAEKLGWPEPLVWAVALEGKTDRECFGSLEWKIRPWDYWSFGDVDHRFGDEWEGRIPAQLVAHTLYFLTQPQALVLDPMAGGGVTADVCLALGRRCWSFDKEDRPDKRPEIEHYVWNLSRPEWPLQSKDKPDLIFFDPPYFKKQEAAYGPDSISSLSRTDYLEFFKEWSGIASEKSKSTTRLALLIADWRAFDSTALLDEDPAQAITIFDYVQAMQGQWEFTHRIEAPLSTERFTGNMVTAMQERRSLGTVSRTLLLFRRRLK